MINFNIELQAKFILPKIYPLLFYSKVFFMESKELYVSTKSDFDNYANEYDNEPLHFDICKESVKIFKDLELLNKEQDCLVLLS